jgi:hypothetical protein
MPMTPAERAARVWRRREQVEREAAQLFDHLAHELALAGYGDLANRARRAGADEVRHAGQCRALIEALAGPGALPAERPRRLSLGPYELRSRDRLLYAALALGCVTESLSCALLLELRESATHPLVATTVRDILADEIEHARIGWTLLAEEAKRRDVSWLTGYVPAIAAAAVADDVRPFVADDTSGLGVLSRDRVQSLVAETWSSVIQPGLAQFGIVANAPALAA